MEKLKQTLVNVAKPQVQSSYQAKPDSRVPTVNEVMGRNMPEKKFRSGAVAATIWANSAVRDGKQVTYRTVSLQRSYKDKNDEWQNTDSLRTSDLPRAILVLQKAYEYVALNNDEAEEESIY
jgi:hypothetical protein